MPPPPAGPARPWRRCKRGAGGACPQKRTARCRPARRSRSPGRAGPRGWRHNQLLGLRRGDHSLDSGGGTFPLVQPGPDGAVGGQDAGALQSLGGQQPGGLPDHVEDGDADILLHPVQEEVGGVAGHGDAGTPRLLQQLGVCQQPLKDRVLGLSSA